MVHILTGANWFGIKRRLDELKAEFVANNGDLAIENIDGEETEFDQIRSTLESLPFLSDQKMVIINRLAKNKTVSERIDELLKISGDDTLTVIVEPDIDKRSSYYKTLKKTKGFIEFNQLDELEMAKWLADQAEQKGGQLSRTEANFLIDRAGNHQQKLANELEKLLNYDHKITKDSIKLLVEPTPQSSIFSLLDAAFGGNLELTLKLYDDQRAQGIETFNILGMLVWQLHAVALVQAAKGKSSDQISAASGVKPFVLGKSRVIAEKLDKDRLQKLLDDLLELDKKFKTTAIDKDNALKNLLASVA